MKIHFLSLCYVNYIALVMTIRFEVRMNCTRIFIISKFPCNVDIFKLQKICLLLLLLLLLLLTGGNFLENLIDSCIPIN